MKGAAPEMDNAEERMTTSDPEPRTVTACVLIIGNEILPRAPIGGEKVLSRSVN
jgi:hypothetical protein